MTVLVTVTGAGISVAAAVLARHRAQAAADLAALAAAARMPAGAVTACAQARSLSESMGAKLRGCDVDGLDVTVAVTVGTGLRFTGEARAGARAGPVDTG